MVHAFELMSTPQKDPQSVTPAGERVAPLIDGVRVRRAVTHPDERGTVCEVFNPEWSFHPDPLVYVYQVTIRPGQVKGWVVHRLQDDRLFLSQGTMKAVLFDDRESSPTYGLVNEVFLDQHNRGLLVIPAGVYHAIQNVGSDDLLFFNMPTRPYNHTDPDKYRLPLNNDRIPYRFPT
ncbi:dTDP-4-dehydrorhamnose 3,5-epimerase [Roseimicrobium gellanilyticum]|uniref:dTDP-4-dehydrorhamnose 3,5-epimerase n=2 Tax=Roseimicrobium gellanilyticum TaxID=748857 RepID=A0A366HBD7_9BACT|nr:dTDP-4-dehydrorhamnose 3,5-epimerase [Roseimicrobium gellanilyticum]